MCAVSFEVAPRNVPIRFAGEVTFFMTSSSFSIILRASTIVSCWSKICGRSSNKSRRTGSPGGNEEITRSNESRRLSGPESPTPSSNPSLRLSLIYGLGQSAEPSLTIASSGAFAIFTRETISEFDAVPIQNVQPERRSVVAQNRVSPLAPTLLVRKIVRASNRARIVAAKDRRHYTFVFREEP